MATITLNVMQERELARLLDYERATCSVNGDLAYRCAFPYRPDDDLQCELVACGALTRKTNSQRQTIVVISSDGYSYFPSKAAEEERLRKAQRRDTRLVGLSALFAALCVVIGFLLGHFLA